MSSPLYSTHDWIAQHALDWLPDTEKDFITDNLDAYLYGTEIPDFLDAVGGDGIGDSQYHHVYYRSGGEIQDSVGAERGQDMFNAALDNLRSGNFASAAKWAGAMAHYIGDLAVFGHVMGASTYWGAEIHHSDYEDHMRNQIASYFSSWDQSLIFDGDLENLSARDAALKVAHDTTFDESGQGRTAVWMDQHYDWSDSNFRARVGQSLSVSVNSIADTLHTLWVNAGKMTNGDGSTLSGNLIFFITFILIVVIVLVMIALMFARESKKRGRRRHG